MCTSPIFDGGFIPVNLTGSYVYLYRAGGGHNNFYNIAEVVIYGITNLVGSATVLTNYGPVSASNGANNLIQNLNNRYHSWLMPPLISPGNKASYNSCFRVDTRAFTRPYVFGLDHGFEKVQNSVLLVQDVLSGYIF